MHLEWRLLDLEQNELHVLDGRKLGGKVEVGLNSYRRATLPLSLEDPARADATPLDTVLQCKLIGPDGFERILINGKVRVPEAASDSTGEQLTINASDSLADCDQAVIAQKSDDPPVGEEDLDLPQYWGFTQYVGVEQSAILNGLISLSDVQSISVSGTLEGAVDRDRTYLPGKNLTEALVEMSEVIFGPDFELNPVDEGGFLAEFNTFWPRQGDDLTDDVHFVFGTDPTGVDTKPQETASAFSHAPGGTIVNRAIAAGAPYQQVGHLGNVYVYADAVVAENLASISEYGVYETWIPLEDVTGRATLAEYAKAEVAANAIPIPYFTFSSALEQIDDEEGEGVPPAFGRDYWIGDTIALTAYLPDGETLELTGRVTDGSFTELDSGQLSAQVTCSPEVSDDDVTTDDILVFQEIQPADS